MARRRLIAVLFAPTLLGCSADEPPASPPCDSRCEDSVALLALRETTKLVYNLTLQANPAGAQDESTSCPLGGSARVFGNALSNAEQGATEVELTYVFRSCTHLELDEEPEETYRMTLDGTLTQSGTLAVQPSASTALLMDSDALTLEGTIYDPPRDFAEENCAVDLGQNGNQLSGMLCGRPVGVDLGGQPN